MRTAIRRIYSEDADFQYLESLRRNREKRNHAREFFVEGVRSINAAVENGWGINALICFWEKRLSDWAVSINEDL